MRIATLPVLDSKPETPDFGKYIRAARLDCGLSQKELAQQVGWESATALSLIETNQRGISSKDLLQIAHTTNKPITFFYEIRPPKNP